MFLQSRYEKIIEIICKNKGVTADELENILKEEQCEYLLFLLLNKYNCLDKSRITKDLNISNIEYKNKKAKECFFLNKEFRDIYFEVIREIEAAK